MATDYDYKCNVCGRDTPREVLAVKKILFAEMGEGARTIRSRVEGWLCPDCVKKDPHWNMEKFKRPGERSKRDDSKIVEFVPPGEPRPKSEFSRVIDRIIDSDGVDG